MRNTAKFLLTVLATMAASVAMADEIPAAMNPANGVWIQQIGDVVPHDGTKATLYYTRYDKEDRVRSITYQYNGNGYLLIKPGDKTTICKKGANGVEGSDGIVHMPNSPHLLIAGQTKGEVYKVRKNATGQCRDATIGLNQSLRKDTTFSYNGGISSYANAGIYHLTVDPSGKWLWGTDQPGYLFRFNINNGNIAKGEKVKITADKADSAAHKRNHRPTDWISALIWDGDGNAFVTYSNYLGGGCEYGVSGENCTPTLSKSRRSDAYFGWVKEKKSDANGNITEIKTKILIDSLEGAHAGTYDPWSKTIFLFGGAKIIQLKPRLDGSNMIIEKKAEIDLRTYLFREDSLTGPHTSGTGWRLDQGTVDGFGHLFVASQTGHVIFVDYHTTGFIDGPVMMHAQWIDNYLDDLAPLADVQVIRNQGKVDEDEDVQSEFTSSGSLVEMSSSSTVKSSSSAKRSSSSNTLVEWGSSSSVKSSGSTGSSNSTGNNSSGSNGGNSSSSTGGNGASSNSTGVNSSGSNGGNSSGSTGGNGGSSNSTGVNSSGSNGGSSSGSTGGNGGNSSGSTGGNGGNDGNSSGSTGGNGGNDGSSSGSTGGNGGNDVNSSGSTGGGSHGSNSSSSGKPGEGSGKSSSATTPGAEDVDFDMSSSNVYFGAEDFDVDDFGDNGYPSTEDFNKGDSVVAGAVIMNPVGPGNTDGDLIHVGGNDYLLSTKPTGLDIELKGTDSAKVGQIIAITLDSNKVKEYFKDSDKLTAIADGSLDLVDNNGNLEQKVVYNADGSVTLFVTADNVVDNGIIKIYGDKGGKVIIDDINFYDPIPAIKVGYIKDSDSDQELDYVELVMADTMPVGYDVSAVRLVMGKDTIKCTKIKVDSNRIIVDAKDLKGMPEVGKFPSDGKAVVSFVEKGNEGTVFNRETNLIEIGSNVIKSAYAIQNKNGLDSLFLNFNIDLLPSDVSSPELLIYLKQQGDRYGLELNQVKKVFMPTKDIVILVGKDFKLKGQDKKGKDQDSVSLHDGAVFANLPYITSDEYDREVPVTVEQRFASLENVEYWDTNGDGVLDQIVSVFDRPVTSEEIENTLYLTFPWHSSRGKEIMLNAQPGSLVIDPKDSTRVIWDVVSPINLAEGITSISEALPPATAYTYYNVFGETFISEQNAPLVDRMSPIIANATLSYGNKADTLRITFSEPIAKDELKGNDFFQYIHGTEINDLVPSRIDWSADGLTAKIVVDASSATILPGDSLVVKRGKLSEIRDEVGNIAGDDPQAVVIGGLLNHLVESTKMGTFDASDDKEVLDEDGKPYTLQTISSVNLRYVPAATTKEDMQKEGALGQLVQLGERFVPQLIDRAYVADDGTYDPSVLDSLKPEDVYISFVVNFYDNLGQYVNDTIITVPCNSPKFGGNCLETDKKVFVNWNFKDSKGRFVGTGVYTVQFKMIVRYENKKIEEVVRDKWGVRRKVRR